VTNKVPLDVLRQGIVFEAQFLLTTLTKDALSSLVSLANVVDGVVLADGNEFYVTEQVAPYFL
jgi:hypothetical protein